MHMYRPTYCKWHHSASVTIPHAPATWEAFTVTLWLIPSFSVFVGGQNMFKNYS